MSESDPNFAKQLILELFTTAGYTEVQNSTISATDLLTEGLAWCIAAATTSPNSSELELLSTRKEDKSKVLEAIEAALRSMGCPYPLQAYQIDDLDYSGIYPAVQWVVDHNTRIETKNKDEDIKKEESDFWSSRKQNHSNLQADVLFEKKISSYNEDKERSDDFKHILWARLEKLNSAKSDLAVKLREVISLKRQLDDVPSQSELIQYERRSSELYFQIQEKLRETRKYYATYNALLEIKELALKETSLLNSIISQYKDAITNPAGRMKLIDSMEGVVKGTEQKLVKVEVGLEREQKLCDALKDKYAESIEEQRRRSSLLQALEEEYTKNEKLRRQTST